MNLREAIEAYANAMISYYSILGYGKQEAESITRLARCSKSLDVVLAVAEAAIALAEYQAFVAYNPAVEDELWRAFKEAHKAAKDANQS